MRGRDCTVVMARQPVPGSTKTRLAAAVGDGPASSLYEAFLLDTLATCGEVEAELLISYAPDSLRAERYVRRIAPDALLAAQPDAPFGVRLAAAMQSAFDHGFRRVAVIGSDIPHVTSTAVDRAFVSLDGYDMALGPTRDGGYYLLALRAPAPGLFRGIDWSSGRELGQTLDRARELGLRVTALEETFDIDDAGDLAALRDLIALNGPGICPRTAAALSNTDPASFSEVGTASR